MKIQIDKNINNNSYDVIISVIEPDVGNYMEAIKDFGESPLNFGGQILDEDDATVLATIADRTLKITEIIETPMTQSFNIIQYPTDAEKIAIRWVSMSVEKIDAYVKEVSSKIDTFSGKETIDI